MKRMVSSLLAVTLLLAPLSSVFAHPGGLDKNGGHNCGETSKAKGLCTGYHLHPERSGIQQPTTPALSKPQVAESAGIKVHVDGKPLSFTQEPVIINNRTMVPLRVIFETLGATVSWDKATKTVIAVKGSDKIQLTVDNTTAFKNGTSITLDAPPVIVNGSTMVPARFVATSLGAVVGWIASTKTVTIETPGQKQTVEVTSVVDGDTIKVNLNGKVETVRLLLVDTPETKDPNEPVQPFGPEASAYAKEKLESKSVKLEFDGPERDKYDRLLAYVWIGDKTFNQMLLEEGLARVAYVYDPPYTHYDEYIAAEKKAIDSKKLIWSIENYVQKDGFHEELVTQ